MLKKETLTVFLVVIIILMIGFGITAATGGLSIFGIKPNIASSANLVGAWSLNESDLTEKTILESNFSSGLNSFGAGRYHTFTGNNDEISDGIISYDDVLKFTSDDQNALHYLYRTIIEPAKNYTATFKFYIPNTNTNLDGLHITGTYGGFLDTNITCKKISDGSNFGTIDGNSIESSKGAWAEVSINFNSNRINSSFGLYTLKGDTFNYIGSNSASDDIIYVKDFVMKELDVSIKDNSDNSNSGEIFRTNLAINGNFDTDYSDWSLNLATPSLVTGNGFSGNALRMVATGGNVYAGQTILTEGRQYKLRFKYRSEFDLYYYNGSSYVFIASPNTGTARTMSTTFTAGGGFFDLGAGSLASVGEYMEIDDIVVEDITFEKDQNDVPDQAMDFDGVGDYIDLGDLGDLGDQFTYSVWFKTSSSESFNMFLNVDGELTGNPQIRTSGGKVQFRFYGGNSLETSNIYNDNKWHFAVGGINSDGDYFLYVDGISEGTLTPSVSLNWNGNTRIGLYSYSTDYYFDGNLSDVKIYEGVLTEDQIMQLYKVGQSSGRVKVDVSDYVTDGGMETDPTNNWDELGYMGTLTEDTTIVHSNSKSLKLTIGADWHYKAVGQIITGLTIGQTYKVSGNVYIPTASNNAELYINNALYSPYDGLIDSSTIKNKWIELSGTFIATQTTHYLRIRSDSGNGDVIYIDDVKLTKNNAMTTGSLQKGLILDMPLNENYTATTQERVTDGGFDDPSKWSCNSQAQVTGGELVWTDSNGLNVDSRVMQSNVATMNGNKLVISFDVVSNVGGIGDLIIDVGWQNRINVTNADVKRYQFIIDDYAAENSALYLWGSEDIAIDNLSMKILNDTVKDRTPYGNDGVVEGASLEYDGLVCLSRTGDPANAIAYIKQEKSYGTWEFDINKDAEGNYVRVGIISDSPDTSGDFYQYVFTSAEAMQLRRYDDGVYQGAVINSGDAYASIDTEYRIKITRSLEGEFTMYVKGGSFGWMNWTEVGSSIDNVHTVSSYLVPDLDNGDKIRNLKINNKLVSLSDASISSGTWTTTAPSYSFDGIDDYIEASSDLDFDINSNQSISFWAKPDSYSYLFALDKRRTTTGTPGTPGYQVYFNHSTRAVHFNIDNGSTVYQLNSGNDTWGGLDWQHWTIVLDSSLGRCYFYKNGEYVNYRSYTVSGSSNNSLTLRVGWLNDTMNFDGQIGGLKIWNRVLSTDEIESLYEKEKRGY